MVFETLGSGGVLRFREADPPMCALRHHAEQAMALLVKGARELTRGRAIPLCVEFTHGRPNARVDYEAILGCPVRFQAECDSVVFADETLRLPVADADNRLLRVLKATCRRIIGPRPAQRRPRPLGARIRGATTGQGRPLVRQRGSRLQHEHQDCSSAGSASTRRAIARWSTGSVATSRSIIWRTRTCACTRSPMRWDTPNQARWCGPSSAGPTGRRCNTAKSTAGDVVAAAAR